MKLMKQENLDKKITQKYSSDFILADDGKRHWFTWQEAVKRYCPGTQKYVNNIWNIYTRGIDKRSKLPLKLWTIAFFIIFSSLVKENYFI